jgi:hypothetical protein
MPEAIQTKRFEYLATNINRIQEQTNLVIQDETPEPLKSFLENVRNQYENETGRKLGILVQGAGPVGGVLFLGEQMEGLEGIVQKSLPAYIEDLKKYGRYDSNNEPSFLNFQLTTQGMTSIYPKSGNGRRTNNVRSELREQLPRAIQEIHASHASTRELQKLAGSFAPTFKEASLPREVVAVAQASAGIFDFAEVLAKKLDVALSEAYAVVILQVLGQEAFANEVSASIQNLIRKFLGDAADLLLRTDRPPIHLVFPVIHEGPLPQESLIALLGTAGPQDRITLLVNQPQSTAREMENQWETQAISEHKLPEKIRDIFEVIGSEKTAFVKSTAKLVARDQERQLGTVSKSEEFLSELGYRGRSKSRLLADKIDEETALIIAASILRNQLADDEYGIQNLRSILRENQIDVNDFISRVQQLVQAIRNKEHLATQA